MFTYEQLDILRANGWVVDEKFESATKDYSLLTDASLLWRSGILSASFWSEGRNVLSFVWHSDNWMTDERLTDLLHQIDLAVADTYYARVTRRNA